MKHSAWVLAVMAGVAGMLLPGSAQGEETYRLERLWPVLQQPCYDSGSLRQDDGKHAERSAETER